MLFVQWHGNCPAISVAGRCLPLAPPHLHWDCIHSLLRSLCCRRCTRAWRARAAPALVPRCLAVCCKRGPSVFRLQVYLRLAGACGSCPSSLTTMTMGIKRRLMERIPVRSRASFVLLYALHVWVGTASSAG